MDVRGGVKGDGGGGSPERTAHFQEIPVNSEIYREFGLLQQWRGAGNDQKLLEPQRFKRRTDSNWHYRSREFLVPKQGIEVPDLRLGSGQRFARRFS